MMFLAESKQVVFYHMARRGVDLANASIGDVESALYAMLGPAASIIAIPMKKELQKLSCGA